MKKYRVEVVLNALLFVALAQLSMSSTVAHAGEMHGGGGHSSSGGMPDCPEKTENVKELMQTIVKNYDDNPYGKRYRIGAIHAEAMTYTWRYKVELLEIYGNDTPVLRGYYDFDYITPPTCSLRSLTFSFPRE